jgi:hypothetical protein
MGREKIKTKSLEYAGSIIDTVREPLIVLDQDLRVVTVSRSFYFEERRQGHVSSQASRTKPISSL